MLNQACFSVNLSRARGLGDESLVRELMRSVCPQGAPPPDERLAQATRAVGDARRLSFPDQEVARLALDALGVAI